MLEDKAKYGKGVSGVPYFIMGNQKDKFAISGGQPPEAFMEAIEDLL